MILDKELKDEIRRFSRLPETEECNICHEKVEQVIDTEGMINGGVGEVCEQCLEDNDIGR